MSIYRIRLEVINGTRESSRESLDFLLDSGVTVSIVPAQILGRLGIESYGERTFRLPNGGTISRLKGMTLFQFEDRIGGGDVLFGEEGDEPIVGTLTLSSLGFFLDPWKRELRELPMLLMRSSSR
jgi:hypothetical protein